MNYGEKLKINNFFSIKEFDWDVKPFNVITGGMASGKSLCMKLLYFFERAVEASLLPNNVRNKEYFEIQNIYGQINNKFNKVFNSVDKQNDFAQTRLDYSFIYNKKTFDLSARCENGKLKWHSDYIENNIDKWYKFFDKQDTGKRLSVGGVEAVQRKIFDYINKDFNELFPVMTVFIPAARAITAITNYTFDKDALLNRFLRLKNNLIDWLNESDSNGELEKVKSILKIQKIEIPNDTVVNDEQITITLDDGRKITPFDLSSGQQELFYFLFLAHYIPVIKFHYNNNSSSFFIEEPSAHLFPMEQKSVIEYIVEIYREMSDNLKRNCKFFISTHSPYVLNVVNNMLKKGALLNRFTEEKETINKEISFPHLFSEEVSACFIKGGKPDNILDEKSHYLDDEEIALISFNIMNESNKLSNLKTMLLDREQK